MLEKMYLAGNKAHSVHGIRNNHLSVLAKRPWKTIAYTCVSNRVSWTEAKATFSLIIGQRKSEHTKRSRSRPQQTLMAQSPVDQALKTNATFITSVDKLKSHEREAQRTIHYYSLPPYHLDLLQVHKMSTKQTALQRVLPPQTQNKAFGSLLGLQYTRSRKITTWN